MLRSTRGLVSLMMTHHKIFATAIHKRCTSSTTPPAEHPRESCNTRQLLRCVPRCVATHLREEATTPQHHCQQRQQPEQRHQPPDMVQLATRTARPSCAKSPACSSVTAGTRCICCIDRFPRAASRFVAASAISHPYTTSWHLVAHTSSCSAAYTHTRLRNRTPT